MAANAVFDVNELLESILLELPAKKVFVVKAVAKQWEKIITESLLLKRKQFLTPDRTIDLDEDDNMRHSNEGLLPPVLVKTSFQPMPLFNTVDANDSTPLSTPWQHSVRKQPVEGMSSHVFTFNYDPNAGIAIPPASRPLYLTQPAVTTLLLAICYDNRPRSYAWSDAWVRDKNGVTLGLIADTFIPMFKQLSAENQTETLAGSGKAFAGFVTTTNGSK